MTSGEIIDDAARYRGALLGLAVGDALGTTLEFQAPGTFEPIDTIKGGGPFHLKPGEWTDDTSMALCLAESLIESQGADLLDQMRRYCRWKNDGYLSSNGRCFDIGATVLDALGRFERTGDPVSGSTDPQSAGNGSLMRLVPVPLFYARNPRLAIDSAAASSRTTHGAQEAVDACRYLAALILGVLQGLSKEALLADVLEPFPGAWDDAPLAPAIAAIAAGSFKRPEPPRLSGTGGYVVPTLAIALWAFYHGHSFREGALMAVNLGFDADTYGATYGQLAGRFYGDTSIPDEWRQVIATAADYIHGRTTPRLPGVRLRRRSSHDAHITPDQVDFVPPDGSGCRAASA